jgi:hypothetical protein
MANKNFKVRQGLEAPLIAADDGTTAITLSNNDVTVVGDLTVTSNTIKSSSATAITLSGADVAVEGTLDVKGGTITDSTGALTITSGATNTNLTLDPNGTGNVVLTLANGGNLTNDRNYVFGAIRNSTTAGIGDIWALNTASAITPTRGISIDNSADTAKTASYLARTYGSNAGTRSRLIFERSRGTAASPSQVLLGDLLGEVDATGYSSTGWVNDTLTAVPGFFGFTATENWVSNTNLGTSFGLSLSPSATTITAGTSLVPTIQSNPQTNYFRADRFAIAQGKTSKFVATGCSTSGTTLTIGTLASGTIATGQVLTFTTATATGIYIVANISGSGSGSTWTISEDPGTLSAQSITGHAGFIAGATAATSTDVLQNLKLIKNTIQSSGGTTQIVTSSAGATLALAGDTITLESSAGTDYMVLNNSKILNNRPHRNVITTATTTEGSTYSPAATDNNSISLTINTGSGTTVIDLANLTGQGDGGMYSIMVFNNAATGTPIQVKNTRINTNNLMTHTIGTGDRIMITAYIVGDYATAEHLVVA